MPHRRNSRIKLESAFENNSRKTKPTQINSRTYDWEKLLPPNVLKRNKWLVEIWSDLHKKNPDDVFIRKLSTDDMVKTKWFEKYGYTEPNFE